MLQGNSSDHNASSATDSGFASRLRSITPLHKVLIVSAIVLTIFISAVAVAANDKTQNDFGQPSSNFTTNSSIKTGGSDTNFLPEAVQNDSKVETTVDVNTSTNLNSNAASPQVELEVNGQSIEVPENGQVNEVITNNTENGNVEVNVRSNFTESESRDGTRIQIDSDSESEVRIRSRN